MDSKFSFLKEEAGKIKPGAKETYRIKEEAGKIILNLNKALKEKKARAEVFIGGSLAKGTIIKKDKYDIDIFVRFLDDKEISETLEEVLKKAKLKFVRIHGSRDYFVVKGRDMFEIIPVLKIKKPQDAKNVTDLSYFHVSYILNEIKKNKKLGEEIMLAKAFCYAQKAYGAESYIKGFSGYALELLVSYYKSFLNFARACAESKNQIVLDPAKHYRNKQEVLLNLNEAKLSSPIVFVDPTFKERNALAALSPERFETFKKVCIKFLRKPGRNFFKMKKIDEKKFNLVLEAESNRQEGDVAGSKLLKFFNFFSMKLKKYFIIKNNDFEYDNKKKARYYFNLRKKKEIIYSGPEINKIENLLAFRNKHKNVFVKKGIAYSREKVTLNPSEFVEKFKKEEKKVMSEMGVISLRIIK